MAGSDLPGDLRDLRVALSGVRQGLDGVQELRTEQSAVNVALGAMRVQVERLERDIESVRASIPHDKIDKVREDIHALRNAVHGLGAQIDLLEQHRREEQARQVASLEAKLAAARADADKRASAAKADGEWRGTVVARQAAIWAVGVAVVLAVIGGVIKIGLDLATSKGDGSGRLEIAEDVDDEGVVAYVDDADGLARR